jgi:hypothetical protein
MSDYNEPLPCPILTNEINEVLDLTTTLNNIANNYNIILPLLKKRGRKSKNEIEMLNKMKEIDVFDNEIIYGEVKTVVKYKKRGRKPKGGKIIQNLLSPCSEIVVKTNVILHLKCFLNDINNNSSINKSNDCEGIAIDFNNKLSYNIIKSDSSCDINALTNNTLDIPFNDDFVCEKLNNNNVESSCDEKLNYPTMKNNSKDVLSKLKELEYYLRTNNINNKKSDCFFCTENFDNPPVYIPKHIINGYYHVYGCFCSPECATGFLLKEQIDSSIKHERYFLLNNMYSKIYKYDKSIKPAPDPYYTLDKFFGNINIDEYRNLIKNNRLYILIDKPITRSLPELHEDNDDFIINNKIIPSNYKLSVKL